MICLQTQGMLICEADSKWDVFDRELSTSIFYMLKFNEIFLKNKFDTLNFPKTVHSFQHLLTNNSRI